MAASAMKLNRTPTASHLKASFVAGEKSGVLRAISTAALLMRVGSGLPPGPVLAPFVCCALGSILRFAMMVFVTNATAKTTNKMTGEKLWRVSNVRLIGCI